MTAPATRRAFLVATAAAAALAGCGFELRRAPALRFKTIQLIGFAPRSPLHDELRGNINASTTTTVVDGPAQAQVVLESLDDARQKVVVASTAVGQVTEFQLREHFTFRLRSIGGRELIPRTELTQNRDMSYTESAALGKEQEEAALYRAMQTDIVQQVMRRLASIQTF
ncbi:MAG TPA: LPS assembly lipoprotein LptE [Burkholderiaceae bacterium]|jgi:LPS-assembly lipoprotein